MATRPEDRYPSSRSLAFDIERWAADEPVSVYRAPASVRLLRWARKHRTGVAIGAGLLQTAVVVLAVSTVLLGQSRARIERERQATELARQAAVRERQAAEAAGARAQAVNNFLTNDLLGQADPERNPAGADVTVRQLLDRAAESLAASESAALRQPVAAMAEDVPAKSPAVSESAALEPGVEGAVRSTIGNAYLELGLYHEADEQLTRAGHLLRQAGAPMEDIIFAQNRSLWAKAMRGTVDGWTVIRAFEESETRLGREHPETVYAADTWAQLYRQKLVQ
jgi:hypothetical protein